MAHPSFHFEKYQVVRYKINHNPLIGSFRIAAGGLVAGLEHSVALTKEGGVFSWGSSKYE